MAESMSNTLEREVKQVEEQLDKLRGQMSVGPLNIPGAPSIPSPIESTMEVLATQRFGLMSRLAAFPGRLLEMTYWKISVLGKEIHGGIAKATNPSVYVKKLSATEREAILAGAYTELGRRVRDVIVGSKLILGSSGAQQFGWHQEVIGPTKKIEALLVVLHDAFRREVEEGKLNIHVTFASFEIGDVAIELIPASEGIDLSQEAPAAASSASEPSTATGPATEDRPTDPDPRVGPTKEDGPQDASSASVSMDDTGSPTGTISLGQRGALRSSLGLSFRPSVASHRLTADPTIPTVPSVPVLSVPLPTEVTIMSTPILDRPAKMDEAFFDLLKGTFRDPDDLKKVVEALMAQDFRELEVARGETVAGFAQILGSRGLAVKLYQAIGGIPLSSAAPPTATAPQGGVELSTKGMSLNGDHLARTLATLFSAKVRDLPLGALLDRLVSEGANDPEIIDFCDREQPILSTMGVVLESGPSGKIDLEETKAYLRQQRASLIGRRWANKRVVAVSEAFGFREEFSPFDFSTQLQNGVDPVRDIDFKPFGATVRNFLAWVGENHAKMALADGGHALVEVLAEKGEVGFREHKRFGKLLTFYEEACHDDASVAMKYVGILYRTPGATEGRPTAPFRSESTARNVGANRKTPGPY